MAAQENMTIPRFLKMFDSGKPAGRFNIRRTDGFKDLSRHNMGQ
jgi:hypothetical protein